MRKEAVETERALVDRCRSGDADAWHQLVLRYQGLVYSVARIHFRDSSLADDIFQDVCLELYRRLETIRDVQALPAWLITVTRRKSQQTLNHRPESSETDADNVPLMDQRIASIEQRFWIEQALEELSERDRRLIEALYFDPNQPSYADIASQLNIPVASIGPTRARCLEKLRKHWEGRS